MIEDTGSRATTIHVRRALDELAVGLAARAEEIARPDDVVGSLRGSGLYRLVLPVEMGGFEAPITEVMDLTERLAAVDGSTAWCAVIGAGSNVFAGHLPEDGARVVFADPDQPSATMLAPAGLLRADDEGF